MVWFVTPVLISCVSFSKYCECCGVSHCPVRRQVLVASVLKNISIFVNLGTVGRESGFRFKCCNFSHFPFDLDPFRSIPILLPVRPSNRVGNIETHHESVLALSRELRMAMQHGHATTEFKQPPPRESAADVSKAVGADADGAAGGNVCDGGGDGSDNEDDAYSGDGMIARLAKLEQRYADAKPGREYSNPNKAIKAVVSADAKMHSEWNDKYLESEVEAEGCDWRLALSKITDEFEHELRQYYSSSLDHQEGEGRDSMSEEGEEEG